MLPLCPLPAGPWLRRARPLTRAPGRAWAARTVARCACGAFRLQGEASPAQVPCSPPSLTLQLALCPRWPTPCSPHPSVHQSSLYTSVQDPCAPTLGTSPSPAFPPLTWRLLPSSPSPLPRSPPANPHTHPRHKCKHTTLTHPQPPLPPAQILIKLAELIEANAEELAKIESLDNGKPLAMSKLADIPLSADHFRWGRQAS